MDIKTNVILVVMMAVAGNCQSKFLGPCPAVPGQTPDPATLVTLGGRWYVRMHSLKTVVGLFDCPFVDIGLSPTPNAIQINGTFVGKRTGMIFNEAVEGHFTKEGYLAMSVLGFDVPLKGLKLLSTDFSKHAIVYNCEGTKYFHLEYFSVLSREPFGGERYRSAVLADLKNFKLINGTDSPLETTCL